MLPPHFVQAITGGFGDAGSPWLAQLPGLIDRYARRWELTLLTPFALSYSYVVPVVRRDGSEAVLKLCVPNPELTTEVAALELYGGRGAARLLASNAEEGALLLERVRPGASLATWEDDEAATEIAAEVMSALWLPLPENHYFHQLTVWMSSLLSPSHRARCARSLPSAMLVSATALARELISSQAAPVLIHGDLHHFNILSSDRAAWLAIDPKGVAAEPAYDTGALLRNPVPDVLGRTDLPRLLARRLDQLAELLGLDRARLAAWAWVQVVLAVCWDDEENPTAASGFLPLVDILGALAGVT